ncbi:MAG TPA: hypothetical protein VHV57_03280 [Acidimicrobiales bacterium]|nr:hypothetical protein [Acidimicrobiales bacterium]
MHTALPTGSSPPWYAATSTRSAGGPVGASDQLTVTRVDVSETVAVTFVGALGTGLAAALGLAGVITKLAKPTIDKAARRVTQPLALITSTTSCSRPSADDS